MANSIEGPIKGMLPWGIIVKKELKFSEPFSLANAVSNWVMLIKGLCVVPLALSKTASSSSMKELDDDDTAESCWLFVR